MHDQLEFWLGGALAAHLAYGIVFYRIAVQTRPKLDFVATIFVIIFWPIPMAYMLNKKPTKDKS